MKNEIPVMRFTDKGITEVRMTIESLRKEAHTKKGSQGTPISREEASALSALAKRADLVEAVPEFGEIDTSTRFENRMAMGEYLAKTISAGTADDDKGLWTWISMIYLDQLLAPRSDGTLLLASEYRYIPDKNRLRYYRHLAKMAWTIFRQYENRARLFLSIPCHVHSDFVEQSQKDDVRSNPNIIDLCLELFYDEDNAILKKGVGASVKREGSFRRLVSIVSPQLYMNFDLYEMSADRIDQILPIEFRQWKTA